jgi:hypothetical protein
LPASASPAACVAWAAPKARKTAAKMLQTVLLFINFCSKMDNFVKRYPRHACEKCDEAA